MSGSTLYLENPLSAADDEIRLLEIELSPVRYRLHSNISLRRSKPQYAALSYCWGDKTSKKKIQVGNHSVEISSSLFQALQQVITYWDTVHAAKRKPLWLWCDQLCIDQKNVKEKSHQVAHMGQIFANAEEVLVCLSMTKDMKTLSKVQPTDASKTAPYMWSSWIAWHIKQVQPKQKPQQKSVQPVMETQKPVVNPDAQQPSVNLDTPKPEIDLEAQKPVGDLATQRPVDVLETQKPIEDLEAQKPVTEAQKTTSQPPSKTPTEFYDTSLQACDNVQVIIDNAWWQRAWVYQEFMLANRATFLVADMWFPWQDLHRMIADWQSKLPSIQQYVDDVHDQQRRQKLALSNSARPWHPGHKVTFREALGDRVTPAFNVVESLCKCWCGASCDNDDKSCCAAYAAVVMFAVMLGVILPLCFIIILVALVWNVCWLLITGAHWSMTKGKGRSKVRYELSKIMTTITPLANKLTSLRQSGRLELVSSMFEAKVNRSRTTNFMFLSDLVQHSRSTQCQDDRDKIFAVLGLLDPAMPYDISPDYGDGNTKDLVLSRTIRTIMNCGESLNIIQQALGDQRPIDAKTGLSSWMPNIYVKPDLDKQHAESLALMQVDPSTWKVMGEIAAYPNFAPDEYGREGYALVIEGICIDQLETIVHDPDPAPWRRFEGREGLFFGTRSTARPGDEVWALFGLDVPLVLSSLAGDSKRYTIRGCAMIWDGDGNPHQIMGGSLATDLYIDQAEVRTITIV